MRVGIVYTSTTPELIETVNTELKKQLGEDVEFLNYEDPSILAEVRDAGFVTAGAAARLVTMFMQAVQDKLLFFCGRSGRCSSFHRKIYRSTDRSD